MVIIGLTWKTIGLTDQNHQDSTQNDPLHFCYRNCLSYSYAVNVLSSFICYDDVFACVNICYPPENEQSMLQHKFYNLFSK